MATKHPTPWRGSMNSEGVIRDARGHEIAADLIMTRQDRDHILSCVNACAGINPDTVPDLLAIVRQLADLGPSNEGLGGHAPIQAFVATAQRARMVLAKAIA